MTTYAIQERAVSLNPAAGPQGKGWQADIAFTLEARNKVQAVCAVGGGMMGNRPMEYDIKLAKGAVKLVKGKLVAVWPPAENDNAPASAGAVNGLTFISMFSGIEAASVAFGPLGWRAICFAEIEKFPSAVLAHHYPDVPNVGDMTAHDWSQYRGKVDVVCGGPPCQAFSVAGLRMSMQDARGNLSLAYMRALHAIKPRNAITENVPGWLNTPDNAFGCFLAGLVGADDALRSPDGNKWPDAGMVAGPLGRAAWRILDAQYFGLAQRRRRVVVVADFGNGADPAAVLFERKGMFGNPAARREAGEEVAPTISARTKGSGGLGTDFDLDGGLIEAAVGYAPEIARCDATREGSSQDYETTTMVAVEVAPTMRAGGDQTGGDRPYGTDVDTCDSLAVAGSLAPTLRAGGHTSSHANSGVMPAIAQTVAIRGRENGGTAELGGEVATALRASQGGGDKPHVLAYAPEISATIAARSSRGGGQANSPGHNADQQIVVQSAVRRLTPMECERLQGFPDGYTRIPVRRYKAPKITRTRPADQWECIDGQWWLMAADGPRYKALGNSWAVPKFRWVGERITRLLAANDNTEHREAA